MHYTGKVLALSLRFFLFCQPEDDEKQQKLTLKTWHLLAFLAFLAVEVRKSAKVVAGLLFFNHVFWMLLRNKQ